MLKKTIATGMALAFVLALGACRQEPDTAAVDEGFTTIPDTATLGVPGGTLGTTPEPMPGTVPADTLGTGTDIPPTTPPTP